MARNITLSLSEDLIRRAKVLAAQRDTSVSGLITELLQSLVGDEDDYATAWAEAEERMNVGIPGLVASARSLTRDEWHAR